jgi:uncharacterized protein YjiS (DUF1127 family)
MTTQNLNPADLPYAKGADLLTAAYNLFASVFRAYRKLTATVGEARAMRNRYYELNALSDASLQAAGMTRFDIPQIVATEAGLFTPNEVVPVASNSNEAPNAQVA